MENNLLISIIIPVYNRPELIVECLDSVIAQTNPNWECIVVDDGSTDNTWQVLQEYAQKDSRIRIYQRIREPKGAPTCRNIGLEKVTGEYVMFFDSDDVMGKRCLEFRQRKITENTDLDALIFETNIFTNQMGDSTKIWNKLITNEDDLVRFLRQDMPWSIYGPIWKNKNTLQFDEEAMSFQDWEYHIRAILKQKKYKKFESDDDDSKTYYRKDEEGYASIGSQSKNKLQVKNRALVVEKTVKFTIESNLTPQQHREVVKLIIRMSKNLRKEGHTKEAFQLIELLKEKNLVSKSNYLFWQCFIVGYTSSFFKFTEFMAYRIFRKREWLNNWSSFMDIKAN